MCMARMLPLVRYDRQRIAEDIAARGWSVRDAARVSGVGFRTIYRFLHGGAANSKTMGAIAKALGTIPETYIQRDKPEPEGAEGAVA